MKITYLGQAGLLFEHKGFTVMIDPYFSESVVKVNPANYRRVPMNEDFWNIKPDLMIFTHDHLDHYDPETAPHFIGADTELTVLCPKSVFPKVKALGGKNNCVQFDPHTSWTEGGLRFTSVKATHSDEYAIGVIIDDGRKKYYVTGDTLYNEEIFDDLPDEIYAVFLPVNGVGNNMNMTDAARFAEKTGAKICVPIHTGMFDELDASEFPAENKIVPKIYEVIIE